MIFRQPPLYLPLGKGETKRGLAAQTKEARVNHQPDQYRKCRFSVVLFDDEQQFMCACRSISVDECKAHFALEVDSFPNRVGIFRVFAATATFSPCRILVDVGYGCGLAVVWKASLEEPLGWPL